MLIDHHRVIAAAARSAMPRDHKTLPGPVCVVNWSMSGGMRLQVICASTAIPRLLSMHLAVEMALYEIAGVMQMSTGMWTKQLLGRAATSWAPVSRTARCAARPVSSGAPPCCFTSNRCFQMFCAMPLCYASL